MATWETFVAGVKDHYYVSKPNEASAIRAVSEFVKSGLAREVDRDLEVSKSYLNSYAASKAALAGYAITSTIPVIKGGVLSRITIDAKRASVSDYIDRLIIEAIDDINAMAVNWNKMLVDCVVDLQRFIPTFCLRQESTYLSTTSGVVREGWVSRITPPGAKVRSVMVGPYYPPLDPTINLVAGRTYQSNGRAYLCVTGTPPFVGPIPPDYVPPPPPSAMVAAYSAGLLTTDGSVEQLKYSGTGFFGSFTVICGTFTYAGTIDLQPVPRIHWSERFPLMNGTYAGLFYTMSPNADRILLYPALASDVRAVVEWDGIKSSFSNSDTVPFNNTAELIVATYLRWKLGMATQADYQAAMRRAWVDSQEMEVL